MLHQLLDGLRRKATGKNIPEASGASPPPIRLLFLKDKEVKIRGQIGRNKVTYSVRQLAETTTKSIMKRRMAE